jgi:phenylalanyl-tRNA synthetase alpha chain
MTEASEAAILTYLSSSPDAVIEDTFPWSEASNLDHAAVIGAIKSLLADEYVAVDNLSTSFYTLTKEGTSILENGAQEIIVLKALEEAGKLSLPDLQAKVGKDIAKIGMGNCMKLKWVKKDGGDLVPLKKLEEVEDEVQKALKALADAKFSADALSDKVSSTRVRDAHLGSMFFLMKSFGCGISI